MVHLQVILKEREEKKRIRLLDESSYLSSGGIIDDDDVTTNDPDCDVEESPDLSQEGQCGQLAGACGSGATLTYMAPLTIDTRPRMMHGPDAPPGTADSVNVGGDGLDLACCMSPASSIGSSSSITPYYKPMNPVLQDILFRPQFLPLPGYGLDSDLTFSLDG